MKMSERRGAERFQVRLRAVWEGVLSQHEATVVDISANGCFLLTRDAVKSNELIRAGIELPTGRWIYLWGEVVYQEPEMGFALRFTGSEETEEMMLRLLLEVLAEDAYSAALA